MKNIKAKKKRDKGFFKEILREIADSLLFEIIWNIIMYIPKIILRVIKNIW